MKSNKTSIMLGVAALAAFASTPAAAQDLHGWYVGGSIGRSAATIDDAGITSGLAGQGLATSSISERDRDTGYKVFGGYQFHRNFAVEAGFFNLGDFGYTATTVPAGSLSGDVRIKGLNLDLVGILPVSEKLSLLGRVGVISARSRGNFSATGAASVPYASASTSERSTGAKIGVGLNYDFTDALALRVEAERYRVKDSVRNKGHVDLLSVGLVYRFGSRTQARAVQPQPAVYVAPPPAPPPAAVAPPPPPAPVVAPAPAPYVAPLAPKPYRN